MPTVAFWHRKACLAVGRIMHICTLGGPTPKNMNYFMGALAGLLTPAHAVPSAQRTTVLCSSLHPTSYPRQALLVSVCHAFPLLEGLEVDCGQCEPPPCAAKPQPSAGPSTAGGLEEGRGANSTQPWVRQQQQQQQQQQAQGYPSSASLSGFGAGEEAPGSAADSTCTSEDEDEGHHAPLDDRTWSLDVQRLSMPLGMYFDPDARSYKCGSFECIQWPALRHLHLRTANMGVGLTRLPVTSTPRLRHVMLTDSVSGVAAGGWRLARVANWDAAPWRVPSHHSYSVLMTRVSKPFTSVSQ